MYPGRNPEKFSGEESNGGEKCEYIRIRSGKTSPAGEREDAWEDGRKDGLAEGERIGRDENRKELIQKKLQKGKTISEIADALEESEAEIQRLIEEMNK